MHGLIQVSVILFSLHKTFCCDITNTELIFSLLTGLYSGIAFTDNTIAGKKSVFKYRLNAEKITDPSCCGSFGACLDCMLLRMKSPLGLGFFFCVLHVLVTCL